MRKRILTALLVSVMTLSATACSAVSTDDGAATAEPKADAETTTESAASGEAGVVYGIYKAGDQTWFIDEGAAAEEAVKANGDSFTYVDAKMSPEEYLKAIDNAIANNAKGIVTCIPDQTMSQAVVDKCKEAGIPIVAADDALQDGDGNKIAPWVGINAYVIGQANGDWLANYAKENGLDSDEECGLLIMTMDTVSSCVLVQKVSMTTSLQHFRTSIPLVSSRQITMEQPRRATPQQQLFLPLIRKSRSGW